MSDTVNRLKRLYLYKLYISSFLIIRSLHDRDLLPPDQDRHHYQYHQKMLSMICQPILMLAKQQRFR